MDVDRDRLAVRVQDLHEVFQVSGEHRPGLKERLYRFARMRTEPFHALNGVSFQVRHGESVALIGHNGSGKSTLLKVVAGILPADRGEVAVNGRVATLLELGAGFHEELTGRENVYMNGAILGLTKDEIGAAFDDIVDFAGVRPFIDQPVRNYSSGMYVRLGFAIAVHVDPEILLIDEVLSVGDANFQEKSLARMRSFHERGKTVVMVSHDLGTVRALCERAIVLHRGQIAFDGPASDAIEAYEELLAGGDDAPLPEPTNDEPGRGGDFRVRVTQLVVGAGDRIRTLATGGVSVGPVAAGEAVTLKVTVTAYDDVVPQGGLSVGVHITRPDVQPSIYETRTGWRGTYVAPPPEGESLTATFSFDARLLTGSYLIDVQVSGAETGALHDRWAGAVELQVQGPGHDFGIPALDADIAVHNPEGVWPAESLPPPLSEGGPAYHPLRDDPQSSGGAPGPGGQGHRAAGDGDAGTHTSEDTRGRR